MLGKLLKYEFRATGRVFFPLYAAMLIVAGITRMLYFSGENAATGFFTFFTTSRVIGIVVTALLMGAVCVLAIILTVQRFNRNLLGDEGYLMFTLPVGTDSLIFSKLIASVVWFISSMILALAALNIAIPQLSPGFLEVLSEMLREMFSNGQNALISIVLILTVIFSFALFILSIYASGSVAMLVSRRRKLASSATWLVIAVASNVVTVIAYKIAEWITEFNWWGALGDVARGRVIVFGLLGYTLAGCAVMYIVTRLMLKKKLNLE